MSTNRFNRHFTSQKEIIDYFKMDLRVENGWLSGHYPVMERIPAKYLPTTQDAALFSMAYYLLPTGTVNPLHKLESWESWQYMDGNPIEIHCIGSNGETWATLLGEDLTVLTLVPPNTWMCAQSVGTEFDYTLVSHFGMPAFDPSQHTKGWKDILLKKYPEQAKFIEKFGWDEEVKHYETNP